MGIFTFFNSYTSDEKELIENYTNKFIPGLSRNEAYKMAKELIDKCIAKSKAEDLYKVVKLGEEILKNEHNYPDMKKKREEGVTNTDIQWFWNLSDVARKSIIEYDNLTKTATFTALIEQGLTQREAVKRLIKLRPIYSMNMEQVEYTLKGTDRPLPFELKNIIDVYILSRSVDPFLLKSEIDNFSSFNAFIRDKIKKGEFK